MKTCEHCGGAFSYDGIVHGHVKRFCSVSCQYRAWVSRNKERAAEIREKSRAKHSDKRLAYGRKYYAEHKEEMQAKLLAWRRKYRARTVQQVLNRQKRVRVNGGVHTVEEWEALKKRYHHRCAHCLARRKLTRDHIVPVSKGGTNDIANIQPLCGPCNSIKSNHI